MTSNRSGRPRSLRTLAFGSAIRQSQNDVNRPPSPSFSEVTNASNINLANGPEKVSHPITYSCFSILKLYSRLSLVMTSSIAPRHTKTYVWTTARFHRLTVPTAYDSQRQLPECPNNDERSNNCFRRRYASLFSVRANQPSLAYPNPD
jgi:hypothetical protein